MSRGTFLLVAVVLALAAAAGGAWVAARFAPPPEPVQARLLQAPRTVPAVPMIDHSGSPLGEAAFRGHWTLVFFGFTHCPDVCPTTLSTLARASRRLDDLRVADRPRVMMVSVDPGRDSPEQLARYVAHFDPSFTGVSVAAEHLPALTAAFGVAYAYVPTGDADYSVDHTAAVFLVDPQARVAAVFLTPHEAETMAEDYRRILDARSAG